jgi:ABC-type Fe3+ transport system substrate-binding protein
MRRFGYILLFFLVLGIPLLAHALRRGTAGAQYSGAAARLVIITPHMREIRDEFRWAFADWHQKKFGYPVEVQYLTPGGSTDIRRQLDTIYRAIRDTNNGKLPPEDQVNTGIDMVWGGGDFEFNSKLKPLGILRPINLDPKFLKQVFPSPALAGVKLYDQDKDATGHPLPPQWIGVCLSSFGIIYNPDLYRALDLPAPKTWTDLSDPNLFSMLSLADPSHSASAAVAYMMVIQRGMADAETRFFHDNAAVPPAKLKTTPQYSQAIDAGWKDGMRHLLLIAANARYFSDSSAQPPDDVARGDAAAGIAIDFYGRVTEQTVGANRETFVAPAAATAITPDPIAILYGTHGKQLELSEHFIEFLLSPEGQRLWELKVGQPGGPRASALRRSPIRQDVYADRTGWADDVNYFSLASGFNQRGQWMDTFGELPQIWAAAWIDDRDDLHAATAQILAIRDEQKRAALLAELSDIPITRADVLAEIAEGKRVAADASRDPDVWRAEKRLQWSRLFAEHYRQVAERAVADKAGDN